MEDLLDQAFLKKLKTNLSINHQHLTDSAFMADIRRAAIAEVKQDDKLASKHTARLNQIRHELHVQCKIERLSEPERKLLQAAYSLTAKEINLYQEITDAGGELLNKEIQLPGSLTPRELAIVADLIADL